MTQNFQYKPRAPESWDKRASGKLFEGYVLDQFVTLTIKDENTIRILPPTWENPQHYGMDIWVHYSVGPGNATVLCLYRMKGEKCPICEAWARAEAAGREDAKELKPTRRTLVWLIDRTDEKTPMVWAMPQTVDTGIAAICRDRMSGELFQIDHPDAGFDVYFQRKQKGGGAMFIEYVGFQLARRPTQVDQKFIDYILEHPLPTTLNWRSYEQIDNLFLGGAVNEEKPGVSASAPTTAQFTPPPPPAVTSSNFAPPPVAAAPPPPPPPPAPAPVQAAPPPPPPPPPAAAPVFQSEYTGGHCSICSKAQYTTPNGVTCETGHYNTPSIEEQSNGKSEVPASTAAPAPMVSRTAALKARFETGKAGK